MQQHWLVRSIGCLSVAARKIRLIPTDAETGSLRDLAGIGLCKYSLAERTRLTRPPEFSVSACTE